MYDRSDVAEYLVFTAVRLLLMLCMCSEPHQSRRQR